MDVHPPRRLGANETAFWRLDEASSLNFAALARVRPGLDPARVRAALASLQARHPLLRAHVELRGGHPWFVWPPEVDPIPLAERAGPADGWPALVEDELPRDLRWRRAPLARAVLVDHGADGATLALILHHAIGDGRGGVAALRDVLWEATTGRPWSPIVYERSRAAEDALPARSRGAGGLARRVRAVAGMVADGRRHREPLRCPVAREAAPHERTYHVEPRTLDAADTAALTARARAVGSTVHGALGAAMVMGVARAAGLAGERAIAFGSPIDVRDRLDPPIGDQLGMYLAVSQFRAIASPRTRLWELARGIRARIADDLESGRAVDALPLMKLFYASVGGDGASAEDFGRRWAATNGTTGLTNVGRIDVAAPPGLAIERIWVVGFPSGLDVFNALASAYAGSLLVGFHWPEPCFDRTSARALVDDIWGLVRAAIAGDPALGSR